MTEPAWAAGPGLWNECASRKEKTSFCHKNGAAAHPHIAAFGPRFGIARVVFEPRPGLDEARTPHFDALLDQQRCFRLCEASVDQPRCRRACRGAGRRILAAVELHPRPPAVWTGWGQDVEKFAVGAREVLPCALLRDCKCAECFDRAE